MVGRITNTAKKEHHPEWCLGGDPGAIEAQETRGQEQLVASTQLPACVLHGDRAVLEAAGVQFGQLLADDPLFCDVTLPKGWEKRPTDHSMWSELVDDKGRVRATMFYKAAFYDRDAFLSVEDAE